MIVNVPTALGTIAVQYEGERLLRLWLPGSAAAPGGFRGEGGASGQGLPAWVRALADDLAAYAAGAGVEPARWAERVDLAGAAPFRRRVYAALLQVGRGRTCTYGELAAAAGSPGAARAVGGAMAANPTPLIVPCHRVVAAGGLGDYGGGRDLKRRLLVLEGAIDG